LLAERLRKLREDAYPRQRDFSAVIGIASSRISDWELGIHEPSLGSLRKYAAAFGMTVAQLLDGVM
jgi:transcriptional regulator with XRE-family HTH domain